MQDKIFRKKLTSSLILLTFLGGGIFLYFIDPDNIPVTVCAFKSITGKLCPGCGGTHSLHYFLHLEFTNALKANALAVFTIPIFSYIFLRNFIFLIRGKTLPEIPLDNYILLITTSLMLFFWIFRNI
ncbi:MAG: DUF2752 domain-containing protein [Ignavibacteria bacterium]